MKKICGLVSGGKDSNYAFYLALKSGYKPACILAVKPERSDSWMFHFPHVSLVGLQAEAMGLRGVYHEREVSGVKEREVEELEAILAELKREAGFEAVSAGVLASRYQYERLSRVAVRLGLELYAPLWGRDPEEYVRRLVGEGFTFIITRISVYGLPPSLLGKPLTVGDVEEVIRLSRIHGFNPAFEGGEAETLLVDAPHYKARLAVEGRPVQRGPYEWELEVESAGLTGKP